MNKVTRRQSLALAAKTSLAGSAAILWSQSFANAVASSATQDRFIYGVASGDPTHESLVIWTKVNVQANKSQNVRWVVSSDPSFLNIKKRGWYKAKKEHNFSVKVHVKGLDSGTRYYYKFIHEGVESEPGRSLTLPEGNLDKLGIAIASCSNFPFGFFNAYDAIASDDAIDFVVHLGDYIYEYGDDGYGAETGKKLGREHVPPHETVSLSDYRLRHAQYKSDLSSRKMHAAHPVIVIWDDHESANNPYMNGAQNHQPEEGQWAQRRDDSLKAYYEWMPIREPKRSRDRASLWRKFEFGNLATMVSLETRHTGRSKQIEYSDHLSEITSPEQRDHFLDNVLGDANRTMLSSEMSEFLQNALNDSVRKKIPWRLIANQIPMARTHVPKISDEVIQSLNIEKNSPIFDEVMRFKKLGELDLPIYTDTWDGYPAAREAFYQQCDTAGANDLLVLTGDSHAFWFNQLFDRSGAKKGIEVGTSGVTSPGDFEYFGEQNAKRLDQLLTNNNDEILWTDNTSKGYVRLVFKPEGAVVDYIAVNTVLSPNYSTSTVKSVSLRPSADAKGIQFS